MTDTATILDNQFSFGLNQGFGTSSDPTILGVNPLLAPIANDRSASSDPLSTTTLVPIPETTLTTEGSLTVAGLATFMPSATTTSTAPLPLTGSASNGAIVGEIAPFLFSQTSGVFTVGQTGQISIDFLADSGAFQSEVAVVSLRETQSLEVGSNEWIQEMVRRAISGSDLGYRVISDATEGARFSGELGERNWNEGAHQGMKTFSFRPGDQVIILISPNSPVATWLDSTTLQAGNRPLASMTIGSTPSAIADITGDGIAFGVEDSTDGDYNDLIFQVTGLTGNVPVINPSGVDTPLGQTILDHISGSIPSELPPEQGEPIVYPIDPATGARYAPGELLVQFKSTATEAEIQGLIQAAGATGVELILSASPEDGEGALYQLTFEATVDLQAVGNTFQQSNQVEYTELNYITSIESHSPWDSAYWYPSSSWYSSWYNPYAYEPYMDELWGLDNYGQTWGSYDADIDAPEAWEWQTGSRNVTVAVIDTGVDYRHRDLRANIWRNLGEIAGNGIDDDGNGYVDDIRGYDFADNDSTPLDWDGHGTHVAGTIGAVGNNGIGVVGVSPKVSLMPVQVLDANGKGSNLNIARGIDYAVRMGANIINASLGGSAPSRAVYEAIRRANEAGVLFVAAAGNDGKNNDFRPSYPTNYDLPNIISVAATDDNDWLADFSNYGATTVDIAAPGVDILSTVPGNGYDYKNGTSMAAPHVAGAAALLLAEDPTLTPAELKSILMDTADFTYDLWGTTVSAGRLNVNNALQSLIGYGDSYWDSWSALYYS